MHDQAVGRLDAVRTFVPRIVHYGINRRGHQLVRRRRLEQICQCGRIGRLGIEPHVVINAARLERGTLARIVELGCSPQGTGQTLAG